MIRIGRLSFKRLCLHSFVLRSRTYSWCYIPLLLVGYGYFVVANSKIESRPLVFCNFGIKVLFERVKSNFGRNLGFKCNPKGLIN